MTSANKQMQDLAFILAFILAYDIQDDAWKSET